MRPFDPKTIPLAKFAGVLADLRAKREWLNGELNELVPLFEARALAEEEEMGEDGTVNGYSPLPVHIEKHRAKKLAAGLPVPPAQGVGG